MTGAGEVAPRASIRSYLDRQLVVVKVDDHYELRCEDHSLARLGDPKFEPTVECVTRDGEWRFTRLRGGHTEATAGTAVVARYRSKFLPGGTIELPDESVLRLRPPVIGETWRVRRGLREPVLEIRDMRTIEFASAAREIYHLPLLTTFALHAVLVEIDRPTGDPTGPPAPATGF